MEAIASQTGMSAAEAKHYGPEGGFPIGDRIRMKGVYKYGYEVYPTA